MNEIGEAEQQGINRSREALADADLILLIHDVTQSPPPDPVNLAGRPHLRVANKVDLVTHPTPTTKSIQTSALTGQGLDTLRDAILTCLGATGSLADTGALNNLRQQQAVTAALGALQTAAAANASGIPHELILVDLHAALSSLDSLTGATTPDDILARIFSTFCIGK